MSQSCKQLGVLVMALVISGFAQAAAPQDSADSTMAQADVTKPTVCPPSQPRASEFIAALKAKLDARSTAKTSQDHEAYQNVVSVSDLRDQK